MKKDWDYIVIGAGHNGLSSACTLAKAGKSVLIVEQRPIIGGLSASHNYVEAAPEHLLSIGAMDDALMAPSSIAKELDLHRHGYNPILLNNPYGWMNEDGDSLILHHDFDATVEEIRYYSAKDARAYADLRGTFDFIMDAMDRFGKLHPDEIGKLDMARTLISVVKDKQIKRTLRRMMSVSAFEMIDESFESEGMRSMWAFWDCMFAPAEVEGTGYLMAGFHNAHREGIYRPQGGMTGLVGAFARAFDEIGSGELKLNSKVERILVENGTASGVRLTSGEEFYAGKGILANCAPQVAMGELVAENDLDPRIRRQVSYIPANSLAVAPYKIDIAVGGRLSYDRAQKKRDKRDGIDLRKTTFMTGTFEQHLAQHDACKRGDMVDFRLPLYFSILSGADPSIAPDGGDVFYVYANSPIEPVGGWESNKEQFGDRVMESVQPFVSGLESELGRIKTCPQDFMDKFSAPNGAYFHVDMIPTRLGGNRPSPDLGGYRTPISRLFLGSCGNHPTGGVSGLPGKLSAEYAMKTAG